MITFPDTEVPSNSANPANPPSTASNSSPYANGLSFTPGSSVGITDGLDGLGVDGVSVGAGIVSGVTLGLEGVGAFSFVFTN